MQPIIVRMKKKKHDAQQSFPNEQNDHNVTFTSQGI